MFLHSLCNDQICQNLVLFNFHLSTWQCNPCIHIACISIKQKTWIQDGCCQSWTYHLISQPVFWYFSLKITTMMLLGLSEHCTNKWRAMLRYANAKAGITTLSTVQLQEQGIVKHNENKYTDKKSFSHVFYCAYTKQVVVLLYFTWNVKLWRLSAIHYSFLVLMITLTLKISSLLS